MKSSIVLAALLIGVAYVGSSFAGDPEADYQAGYVAYREEDLITAMQTLERAATAGHAKAQVLLGYIHDQGDDNALAAEWYQKAVELGEPEGMLRLALLYLAGEGVDLDPEKGFDLLRESASRGFPEAMYAMAQHHEKRTPPELEAALQWYRQAADAGQVNARQRLFRAYSDGELGLQPDPEMADQYKPIVSPDPETAEGGS